MKQAGEVADFAPSALNNVGSALLNETGSARKLGAVALETRDALGGVGVALGSTVAGGARVDAATSDD